MERKPNNELDPIKVANNSSVKAVAGSISHTIRKRFGIEGYGFLNKEALTLSEGKKVITVKSIGANATNIALKSITIARSNLEGNGVTIGFQPELEDHTHTMISFNIFLHKSNRK